MKYLLLIYSKPASWNHPMCLYQGENLSPAERAARPTQFTDLYEEILESGELIESRALADPINTRTVRIGDEALAATDGPCLASEEQLAGYFVVDCDTSERAVEIASRLPDARQCAIEVRPIMDMSGAEM